MSEICFSKGVDVTPSTYQKQLQNGASSEFFENLGDRRQISLLILSKFKQNG